ncbi:MAG: hypothetical protein P1U29_03310 [Candidatus Pelagibacter bacterium]|jgi:hypothetical protein|nr:hypothetical protein [Candidatus Pelagibacter bacterium]|tara:strand:- start:16250 stop:16459 length:210 start_codon:yes stop_codon:yes gene_type:complete
MRDSEIIALTTFVVFSAEAYGHYLVAKNEDKDDFKFYVPKFETSVKNLMIVGSASLLSAYIVGLIKKSR